MYLCGFDFQFQMCVINKETISITNIPERFLSYHHKQYVMKKKEIKEGYADTILIYTHSK